MKKKRDDNRKKRAGNSSDAKAGGSSNIIGLGGEFGNVNLAQNDECHNTHTPCSVLVKGIVGEIFPSLQAVSASTSKAEGMETKNKDANGKGATEKNNGQENGKSNGKRKSNDDGKNDSKDSSSLGMKDPLQSKQQPLLGNIILHRLISDRERARDQNLGGITAGENGSSTTNDVSNAKKKKKKKRKKKNGFVVTATSSVSSTDGGDDDGEGEGEGDIADNVKEGASSSVAAAASASSVATESSDSRASNGNGHIGSKKGDARASTPLIDTNSSSPTEPGAGKTVDEAPKGTPSTTNLDVFLDSIIDSGKIPDAIPKRDLDSFSAFLARKFVTQFREYNRRYQQQQNSNEKIKGGGRRDGKENNSPDANDTSDNNLSIEEFEHFMPCMEFRDSLPTVPLNEVKKIAELITCRQCRTAALHYLRSHSIWSLASIRSHDDWIEEEFKTNDPRGGKKNQKKLRLWEGGLLDDDTPERCLAVDSCSLDGRLNRSGRSHGGLSIPIIHDDLDCAFDYLALDDSGIDLETGLPEPTETNHGAKNVASFRVELYPVHDSDQNLCLQMEQSVSCKEGIAEYPFSSDDIIRFIRTLLLPFGMEMAQFSNDDPDGVEQSRPPLSDRDFNIISGEAKDLLNEVKVAFAAPDQLLQDLRRKMDEVKDSNNRTHFDSTTATKLHEVDKQCDGSVIALGNALLTFTRICCYVGWSSEYGPFLMEKLTDAWKKFDDSLQSMVKPVMEHRGNRVGVEGRPGAVPHAYLSATVRASLEKTVRAKLESAESLHQSLNNLILGVPPKKYKDQLSEHAPSVMLILSIVHSYYKCVHRDQSKCVFPSREIEMQVRDLIDAKISLAQKTTISASLEQMKSKEKEMYDDVREKDAMVFDVVEAQMIDLTGEESPLQFLMDGYDKHEAIRVECDKQHHLLAAKSIALDDYHLDHADVTLILKKSHETLMQLIYLICMRQHKEHPGERKLMSLRLKHWMERAKGCQYASTDDAKDDGKSENCDGRASSDGRRRINSIVSTFLYRWLEARCSEWHAELTRDELLQSMEMDDPVLTVSEGVSKLSKKKKSKRKAGGVEKLKDKENSNTAQNETNNMIVGSKEEAARETEKIDDDEHNPINATGDLVESTVRPASSGDNAGRSDGNDDVTTNEITAKVKEVETVSGRSIRNEKNSKPITIELSKNPKTTLGGELAKTPLRSETEYNSKQDSRVYRSVNVSVQPNVDKKSGQRTVELSTKASGKESTKSVQQPKLETKNAVKTTEQLKRALSEKESAQSTNQPKLREKTKIDPSESLKSVEMEPAKRMPHSAVEWTLSEEQSSHDLKKKTIPSIGQCSQEEALSDSGQGITQHEPVDDFLECHSLVGVADSQEIVPAETYLMGRMETILASIGKNSLPSSKKVRIVRL
mmetsp:Transcript_1951/g.4244  ORF Transcript_1951/g.4244 Transcript_1951/m.4244 type:complete len:1399 (+) Transcript_1951:406-4602(+)